MELDRSAIGDTDRTVIGGRADLPPFSGDDPTCPKCGHVGARTDYANPCSHGGVGWFHYEYPTGPRIEVEHLRRECNRCSYGWPEATVEQPKEANREPLRDDGSCGCCGASPIECVCPGECVCPCPPGKDRNC